jgi:hypothetical protein
MEMTTNRASLQPAVLLVLAGLAGLLAADLSAQTTPAYTEYVLGEFVTKPVEKMQEDEEWSKQGHMPWRAEPALVARCLAADIMPPMPLGEEPTVEEVQNGAWLTHTLITSSVEVSFEVVEESEDRAAVAMRVDGLPEATIWLERPFGYWWYITSIQTASGLVSRPTSGAHARWVSLRDALSPRGFGVYWWPREKRAVAVRGSARMELTVGDREVHIGGRLVRLETAPQLARGRVLVPEHLIVDLLSEAATRHASLPP